MPRKLLMLTEEWAVQLLLIENGLNRRAKWDVSFPIVSAVKACCIRVLGFMSPCQVGSAIAPELFEAAIEIVPDLVIRPTGEIETPIHDALNWKFTRFGYQVKATMFAAIFHNEGGAPWQVKTSNVKTDENGRVARSWLGGSPIPWMCSFVWRHCMRRSLTMATQRSSTQTRVVSSRPTHWQVVSKPKKSRSAWMDEDAAMTIFSSSDCGVGEASPLENRSSMS